MKIRINTLNSGEVEFDIANLRDVSLENAKGSFENLGDCNIKNMTTSELKDYLIENCDIDEFIDIETDVSWSFK